VRASRLVGLLGLLQARGRMSTTQLAGELEVSPRTILRDIEALSSAGIPVYAVRGRLGGFELLDGFTGELPATRYRPERPAAGADVQRARVCLSPRGRRLAALLGRPAGLRIRRHARPAAGREDWVEAWVLIDSADAAVLDMLALGAEVEVVHPPELRARIAETARQIADLHAR
jgi:predicted DNA-binding transcriptional regulator YafY